MSKSALAHILLLLTALVWGATFVLVKAALANASPLLFNLLRMSLATVALVAINFRDLRALTTKHLKAALLVGLFLAAGYQFQTLGIARTTPAKAAFITGMIVVFVPALTLIPIFRTASTPRPGPAAALGAAAAFAGLLFLTTPAGTTLRTLLVSIGPGDLITLIGSVAFAIHLLALAHFAPSIPPGLLATLQVAGCTLFMLLTLPAERPHAHFTLGLIVALMICALLATAAAFTIQSFAQQHLPPTHTVLLLALEPVFAALTSALFFHERFTPRSLVSAALILAGIALIELLPATHSTEIPA